MPAHRRSRSARWLGGLLLALWWLAPAVAQQQVNNNVKETATAEAGRDPHAYETAREMYRVARRRPLDDAARSQLKLVSERLEAGADFVEPEVDEALQALEPCRSEPPVQEAALRWARQLAEQIGEVGLRDAPHIGQADTAYRNGQYAAAVTGYQDILKTNPGHLDARNNLGLAAMALGRDLTAQCHWETLRALRPSYFPAVVNLTVAYERLRRPSLARSLSERAMTLQKDNHQARFNAAWYAEADNRLTEAIQLLTPLPGTSDNPKYARFLELVRARQGEESFPWDNTGAVGRDVWSCGLAAIYGGPRPTPPWLAALAVFCCGTGLILWVSAKIGSANWGAAGNTAALLFGLLGLPWCLAFWGGPVGVWWALPVTYTAVGVWAAFRWAESS